MLMVRSCAARKLAASNGYRAAVPACCWAWEVFRPNQTGVLSAHPGGGAIYWAEGRDVFSCASDGEPRTIATLPQDVITDAIDRHERLRGRGPLVDPVLRQFPGVWRVSFDEARGLFFCANALVHVVFCLDAAGRPLWCECLAPRCCGGIPHALPNGLYAASGGCNGVVSWIDAGGALLLQSLPHHPGLGGAFGGDLEVTNNGRILVNGGPGLVCYSHGGDHLWTIPHLFSEYAFDPTRGIIVTCGWRRQSDNGDGISVLERYEMT
jgi:hypothetical protein